MVTFNALTILCSMVCLMSPDPTCSDPPEGMPCSSDRTFLPPGTLPTPPPPKSGNNWSPFTSHATFELANLLYTAVPLSNNFINKLLNIWSATLVPHNNSTPILNHADLHVTINAIKLRHVPWKSYTIQYDGLRPENMLTPE